MTQDYDKPAVEYFSKRQDYEKPAPEFFRKQGNQWTPVDSLVPAPHPIAPPSEVIGEWWNAWVTLDKSERPRLEDFIAVKAAQYGADQELEACCVWVNSVDDDDCFGANLRAARRPKPPSLKELALESVKRFEKSGEFFSDQMRELEFIRKALEQLDD
jgi:hypothetical protein